METTLGERGSTVLIREKHHFPPSQKFTNIEGEKRWVIRQGDHDEKSECKIGASYYSRLFWGKKNIFFLDFIAGLCKVSLV